MTRVFARAFSRVAQATCIIAAIAIGAAGYACAKPAPNLPEKPRWTELSPPQQQALAPLADEWDKLTASQKKKWLAISAKFPSLKPDQQARLQDRMRDWIKLTPEQRRVARESYSHAKKLNPDQKAAEWRQYQQLPEDQKKKLADDAAVKKRITNLPPAAQTEGKLTPPAKPPHNSDTNPSRESTRTNAAANQPPQQPSTK